MKRKVTLSVLFLLAGGLSIGLLMQYLTTTSSGFMPQPTNGFQTIVRQGQEEGENTQERERWLESMHRAAPGDDWKAIEYTNSLLLDQKRDQQSPSQRGGGDPEVLANGRLTGYWKERGSLNQAGSVMDTEYDLEDDLIYTISAGGSLWKGKRDGSFWEVVHQNLRFNRGLLELLSHNGGKRMLAFIGRKPHYSDDLGLNWTPADGWMDYADSWGTFAHPLLTKDSSFLYALAKPSYWENWTLYKSEDLGESFSPIVDLNTHDGNDWEITEPYESGRVILTRRAGSETRFYEIDQKADTLKLLTSTSSFTFNNRRANLVGALDMGVEKWYAYSNFEGFDGIYQSQDQGQTWTFQGTLGEAPWAVGLYLSPSNPQNIYVGGVECYRSPNEGKDWIKINDWGAYYSSPENTLHADIMNFAEFVDPQGDPFLLIGNHGGMSISENYLLSNQNIGLSGLNVSQYYSVRTPADSPYEMYAGSQDQGFQRAFSTDEGLVDFDQVISGDYGHIVFTGGGSNLWTVYPGGWVTFYANVQTGGYSAAWELDSSDESVWLPPLMSNPYSNEDIIYMAGGNMNGGPGSYIIKLTASVNSINAEQLPFNFKNASGGGILTAIAASPVNPDRWFAATDNGQFFYSLDGGQNWTKTVTFLPSGHYLYGQKILPSQWDEELVFLGGSGYSNSPVWRSENGGLTFSPMNNDLPPTLVFDMVCDPDENMLFAGTETGPFVYLFDEDRWYDMFGMSAPLQSYWSVEFVEAFNIVRFGTYGRGIWDFEVEELAVSLEEKEQAGSAVTGMKIYPNPSSSGRVQLNVKGRTGEATLEVFDLAGKKLLSRPAHIRANDVLDLDLSPYQQGVYWITLRGKDWITKEKVILTK
jgi:photosystem II stability/assembly factor-like uncharacterized protein